MDITVLPQKSPESMEPPELTLFAEYLAHHFDSTRSIEKRNVKGQFFTPRQVSLFMAGLLDAKHDYIRLLDPGAGTGVLIAAFCEQLLSRECPSKLVIDAYENDHSLIDPLYKTLEKCKNELHKKNCFLEFCVYEKDFILTNIEYFKPSLFSKSDLSYYDFVIANPPYYKINKDASPSLLMSEIVEGQPNIYALFIALAISMMKINGEAVFITPRSFCSGLYFKKFREWLITNAEIKAIHIFESRKDVFDDILQESIIVKLKRTQTPSKDQNISVSASHDKTFNDLSTMSIKAENVVFKSKNDTYIRIPTTQTSLNALHIVDKWHCTLHSLGLEISTGPVVAFRAEKFLVSEVTDNKACPLIWMHNLNKIKSTWPIDVKGKAKGIVNTKETSPILLPVDNYILIKRFTSKEQKRRLHASVLIKSEFPYECVGLENHVNYIHKPRGKLTVHETYGLAALFNTTLLDNYFRAVNGNTQVNATEIRDLPLPDMETIIEIGKIALENSRLEIFGTELEEQIYKMLGLEPTLANSRR